jgi:hypothetical protein
MLAADCVIGRQIGSGHRARVAHRQARHDPAGQAATAGTADVAKSKATSSKASASRRHARRSAPPPDRGRQGRRTSARTPYLPRHSLGDRDDPPLAHAANDDSVVDSAMSPATATASASFNSAPRRDGAACATASRRRAISSRALSRSRARIPRGAPGRYRRPCNARRSPSGTNSTARRPRNGSTRGRASSRPIAPPAPRARAPAMSSTAAPTKPRGTR